MQHKSTLDLMERAALVSLASNRKIDFDSNVGTEDLRQKLRDWEKARGKRGLRPIEVRQEAPSWQGSLAKILASLETLEERISELEQHDED